MPPGLFLYFQRLVQVQCTRGMVHTEARERILVNGNIPVLCDTETDGGGWLVVQVILSPINYFSCIINQPGTIISGCTLAENERCNYLEGRREQIESIMCVE